MRSVRIAAAAGIVATGLALGAAGIASAATPNTAPAPAPAQTKTAPAPTKSAPVQARGGDTNAAPRVVKISPAKARAIAEARAEQLKAAAAHSKTAHTRTAHATRANYVVTASHLNVRSGPGTKYRVVGTLARGAHVVAGTKTVDGFRQLSNGHWVSAHYLKAGR